MMMVIEMKREMEKGTGDMNANKKEGGIEGEFSAFLLKAGVVKFGLFKLKSGRTSPYFVNLGAIGSGRRLWALGSYYARAIVEKGLAAETDLLFGPSYKGIPIAVSASLALYREFGIEMRFAFNRKEAKDHGEGGMIAGGELRDGDRVGILDDVMTTGKTKEEVLSVIRGSAKAEIKYIMIAVDRLERGETEAMATSEFERRYGIRVVPIITILDLVSAAKALGIIGEDAVRSVEAYLREYGGKA